MSVVWVYMDGCYVQKRIKLNQRKNKNSIKQLPNKNFWWRWRKTKIYMYQKDERPPFSVYFYIMCISITNKQNVFFSSKEFLSNFLQFFFFSSTSLLSLFLYVCCIAVCSTETRRELVALLWQMTHWSGTYDDNFIK